MNKGKRPKSFFGDNEAATNLASFRSSSLNDSKTRVKNETLDETDDVSDGGDIPLPSSLIRSASSSSIRHRKLNSSTWTAEEDERLKEIVNKYGAKTWHVVAKHMRTNPVDGKESYGHHTAVQCMCRYKNVLDICVRKGPWTEDEDDMLRALVEAAPMPHKIKWREVAEHLSGRLGKQCRERWFNQLDPSINMGPWKTDEDQGLLEAQRKFGNRWNKIAKMLKGRTENAVKNRFNSVSFRRWKDAVEGCLELESSTSSSSNCLSSSPSASPILSSLSSSSILPPPLSLSLTLDNTQEDLQRFKLAPSPIHNIDNDHMPNSLSSFPYPSQSYSYTLAQFQEDGISKSQRKRFRYEREEPKKPPPLKPRLSPSTSMTNSSPSSLDIDEAQQPEDESDNDEGDNQTEGENNDIDCIGEDGDNQQRRKTSGDFDLSSEDEEDDAISNPLLLSDQRTLGSWHQNNNICIKFENNMKYLEEKLAVIQQQQRKLQDCEAELKRRIQQLQETTQGLDSSPGE